MAEEIKNAATQPNAEQMVEYINQLQKQLQDVRLSEVIAQLNFLFKVIELKDAFPASYVKKCVSEIQKILVITDDKKSKKEEA